MELPRPVKLQVGVFSLGYALLAAILALPGAQDAASPVLYVLIIGGIFVCVPATVGVGLVSSYLRDRKKGHSLEWSIGRAIPSPVWYAVGGISGLIAGRTVGRIIFPTVSVGSAMLYSCVAFGLTLFFAAYRNRFPTVVGWCLWLGTFSLGLIRLR